MMAMTSGLERSSSLKVLDRLTLGTYFTFSGLLEALDNILG